MSNDLTTKHCVPCEGDVPPLEKEEAEELIGAVEGWTLDDEATSITKDFSFKDFKEAMEFVNHVAEIAEEEGHHPDIAISYSDVTLSLTTHAIDGLSENDFIVAAKIDVSEA